MKNFEMKALELGGELVNINSSASITANIFELENLEITTELLSQKERNLRKFLEEANKDCMQGSLFAIDYLEKFEKIPGLEDNSEWKERVRKTLQEFAEQLSIKNLRSRAGMSQSLFANYIGVPVRTLQEWEQDKRTPSAYIVKMIQKIMQLEKENIKEKATERVLVEQYTEKDYTWDQLVQIYTEKMRNCRKEGIVIEFVTQKPVLDEKEQVVIGVTTDFPAELNIYKYRTPFVFDIFDKNDPFLKGCREGKGKSFNSDMLKNMK